MNEPDYFDAVKSLVSGGVSGPTSGPVSDYIFHDGQTPPTEEAIQSKLKELTDEYKGLEYSRKRKEEYPSIERLVVALYDAPDKIEVDKLRAEVQKKYPKPT